MVTPAIETRGLTKTYGPVRAVDALDLRIQPREVYGFLGLNGAGKTTTVRMLTGILPPTAGEARIGGVPVAVGPHALAGKLGVVFGENHVPEPKMSPVRYLRHFGALHGLTRAQTDERARDLLSVLRLHEFAERPIGTLSGGNQRKVEIARALLPRPQVLFLDEPTREFDIPAKRSVWQFLRQLADDGLTIFLSTHDVQEIASLCTRIGVLRGGRLAWEGTPAELAREDQTLVDALVARLEDAPAAIELRQTP